MQIKESYKFKSLKEVTALQQYMQILGEFFGPNILSTTQTFPGVAHWPPAHPSLTLVGWGKGHGMLLNTREFSQGVVDTVTSGSSLYRTLFLLRN